MRLAAGRAAGRPAVAAAAGVAAAAAAVAGTGAYGSAEDWEDVAGGALGEGGDGMSEADAAAIAAALAEDERAGDDEMNVEDIDPTAAMRFDPYCEWRATLFVRRGSWSL